MLKQKIFQLFVIVGAIFLSFLTLSCTNTYSFRNGEYKAILVSQPVGFSSCTTDFKVEIKNHKLMIEDEEVGPLSNGKISRYHWMNSSDYVTFHDVELDSLMNIEKCFVIENTSNINEADCFYLITNENDQYLLFASKSEDYIGIFKVYLLSEI